jgi:hypothetical protein
MAAAAVSSPRSLAVATVVETEGAVIPQSDFLHA